MWMWRCWHRLAADRTMIGGGMGGPSIPGDTPWTVVRQWAEFHRMTRGEFRMLDVVIQALDAENRTYWIRKANEDGKGKGKGKGRNKPT